MFMLLYPACEEATAAKVLCIQSQRASKQLSKGDEVQRSTVCMN
jgi:hypothetical protein